MNLEQLRQLLEKVVADQDALLKGAVNEKGEIRELNKEESDKFAGFERQADYVQGLITKLEKVEASRAKVSELSESANEAPHIQVIREDKHDAAGEYRGFRTYGEQLQAVARAAMQPHKIDKRLVECHRAASGANETIDSQGGFAVQSDFAMMLFSNVVDAGVLAPLCTQLPTQKNSIVLTLLDETSKAIGSQFGGVRAYWRAEAGTVTATKPKYRQERIEAEALEAVHYITDELLEDAPALQAWFSLCFEKAMGFQLDDSIMRGDGAGKPLGILNSPALISVSKESGQAADTIVFKNIDNMLDRMHTAGIGKAVWLRHRAVGSQLRRMVLAGSSSDMPVFLPAGAYGTPEERLYGAVLRQCEHCSDLGDLGDIIFADMSQYLLLKKTGIQASASSHVAFLTGEQVFKWTMRVNGMPLMNSAVTDAHGSGTTSPFVALAARA